MNNDAVSIGYPLSDPVAGHPTAQWALGRLREALDARGLAPGGLDGTCGVRIWASGTEDAGAAEKLRNAGLEPPTAPESFVLARQADGGAVRIAAVGADPAGLAYALLELADRVRCADDALRELSGLASAAERPATPIRSVTRLFVNEIEDKPWFYDRSFWNDYLTELAEQRFNRFSLALGIGYDSGHDPNVKDNYFCFAYPFFLDVPGYGVRAANLPAGEAARNLETLRYIGEQAKLRGLHFQLGLWTHSYAFPDSPQLRYPIEGVTPDNHAAYCRDALRALLAACPSIDGVTFRVHYESGIPEPAPAFWRVVMEGAERSGRRIEIDMHAKGVDDELVESARATGSPVVVSAKYWAEHLGLPYHQADIRPLEKPRQGKTKLGFDAVTAASRRFTRYGYGDFLKANRAYDVIFRVWPGTQRLLLWGDPALAAGYGRAASFGGASGFEWFDPMAFKARKDSGAEGGREPYADPALRLAGREWEKYRYTYRLWGRLLYNPDADPDSWRRYLRSRFGRAADACGEALAHASRILPLVTVAHHPSAANNLYWPEMYTNQPIVGGDGAAADYAFDTPAPHTFGSAMPLDPQLFYRIDDYADDLLAGRRSGKYGPLEVAGRLEALAAEAERQLAEALSAAAEPVRTGAEFRRLHADVAIQLQLGRFFAGKLRAALAYAICERTGDAGALRDALAHYRAARAAWAKAAEAGAVYKDDVAFGFKPYARGHWRDRLTGIDADIAAMERAAAAGGEGGSGEGGAYSAAAAHPPASADERALPFEHRPPAAFRPGSPLEIAVAVPDAPSGLALRLYFRRAHQAESFESLEMARGDDAGGAGSADSADAGASAASGGGVVYRAAVPAAYTETDYPIVYYFEARTAADNAWLWPGLGATLSDAPYYTARPAIGEGRR